MLATIKQVSIFIICAQVILHFKAEQKYGKYLKLIIGIMVLVQLFVPLMSLFGQGEEVFAKNLADYMSRFAGNEETGENTFIPDGEDFTELQIREIKSIFNNVQVREENVTATGEQGDIVQSADNASGATFGEGQTSQTADSEAEIMIERIEVKPDDG